MVRILIGVLVHCGLRWVLRFADDIIMLGRSSAVTHPLLMTTDLVKAWSVLPKMSKFRGGVRTESVGYYRDFEAKELGVSDRRCNWAARWCRTKVQGVIEVASFCEGYDRLAFAAGILRFVRPFLGPLYASCAAVGRLCSTGPLLTVVVLWWFAEDFDEKRSTSYVRSTKALGKM